MTVETLTALVAERWPRRPDGHHLPRGARAASPLTYADADREIGPPGPRPRRRSACSAGDRVAVQVEKSPAAVLLYLACVRAGAVLLPMNTAYTDDEVDYLVGDAEPSLLVQDPGRAGPRPT